MFLSASPQEAFRSAEIMVENTSVPPQSPQNAFRASEIVAQNTAAKTDSVMPRLLIAGGGVFLAYMFLKGMK